MNNINRGHILTQQGVSPSESDTHPRVKAQNSYQDKSGEYLSNFERKFLEKQLEKGLSKQHSQGIHIMLLVDDGKSQTEICARLGCSRSTARCWTTIAKSGQAHQWMNYKVGRPKTVSDKYLQRLRELVNQSPREVQVPNCDFTYSTGQWTAKKLSEHLSAELCIKISDRHINRLLKKMGLSTRPKHSPPKNNHQEKTSTKGIVISDIQVTSTTNSSEELFFNVSDSQGLIQR